MNEHLDYKDQDAVRQEELRPATGDQCYFWLKGGRCNFTDAPDPGHSRCLISLGRECMAGVQK